MHFDFLYAASGLGVGFVVGLTGVGGGSLMTPLLILLFGIHPATAVGTDLLYAAITKAVGSFVHGRHNNVEWRIVAWLALGSAPVAALTLLAISRLGAMSPQSAHAISVALGFALLATSVMLIFRSAIQRLRAGRRELSPRALAAATVCVGALLGFFVSITSVGAGALGVTALLLLYPSIPIVRIVGTDIAHAVPLTLIPGVGYWMLGSVDFAMLASLLAGSIPGIIVGSKLAPHAPETLMRCLLAAVLAFVGAQLVLV